MSSEFQTSLDYRMSYRTITQVHKDTLSQIKKEIQSQKYFLI